MPPENSATLTMLPPAAACRAVPGAPTAVVSVAADAAQTAAATAMAVPCLTRMLTPPFRRSRAAHADAWIERRLDDVHDHVDHHRDDRREDDHPRHQGVVELLDGVQADVAEARQPEDLLHEQRPA